MAVDYTFQNVVKTEPAIGLPGGYAAVNPIVSTPLGYIAKSAVTVGAFCWEDSEVAGQVVPSGSGLPLGFVVREVNVPMSTSVDYTNTVPAGAAATIAVEGDFFVQPAASVTKGQKVFANTTTGLVSGASAGSVVAGAVETNWEFATSAGAGEIAIITNHGQKVVPASAIDLSSYETSAHAASTYSTIANTVTAVVAGTAAHTIKVTKNGADTTVEIPQE